jgi:hypothetical protein
VRHAAGRSVAADNRVRVNFFAAAVAAAALSGVEGRDYALGMAKKTAKRKLSPKFCATIKKRSRDPEWRAAVSAGKKRVANNPKWRNENAAANKKLAQDPKWVAANSHLERLGRMPPQT